MNFVRLVCDRVRPNNYKFYELWLSQNVFGEWCVERRWGRMGLTSNHEIRTLGTREEAEAE